METPSELYYCYCTLKQPLKHGDCVFNDKKIMSLQRNADKHLLHFIFFYRLLLTKQNTCIFV